MKKSMSRALSNLAPALCLGGALLLFAACGPGPAPSQTPRAPAGPAADSPVVPGPKPSAEAPPVGEDRPSEVLLPLTLGDVPEGSDVREGEVDGAVEARPEETATRRAVQREMLRRSLGPLEEVAERERRQASLPRRRWVGEDQSSNLRRIDRLLDEVIEALELGEASATRSELRRLEAEGRKLEEELVRAREQRLVAPERDQLTLVGRVTGTSAEEWAQRVSELEARQTELEERRRGLEERFARELAGLGLDLDADAVRSLLSTVSGEGFLRLVSVFDNVRTVTVQLQELTEASGESLDAARRYYGCYVALLGLLDRLQREFLRDVTERHLPALDDFERRAAANIAQAERNRAAGGDPRIAEQNIRANRLTQEATRLYRDYLGRQASAVEAQNRTLALRLADARNTLETVRLSSNVAALLSEGRRQVEALLDLDVPALRGFENRELEREFHRLTRELGGLN